MISILKNVTSMLRQNKKGNAWVWVIVAIIIGVAIIGAMYMFTSSQTHPFWEVK